MYDEPEESVSIITIPLMLILIAVCLFVALLQKERDLALLSALVLGTTGFAKIWSFFSLKNLHSNVHLDRIRVFPGEQLTLKISVINKKLLPVLVHLNLSGNSTGLAVKEGSSFSRENGLLWYQKGNFTWDFTALNRGVHSLGPLRLAAGDFLGFYKKEKQEEAISVIVYPKVSPVRHLPLPGRDLFGKAGMKSPVFDPVYILGTRDYQHWQPARYIHWKASARHNRLQEKVFDPSEQEKILLAIDVKGFSEKAAIEEFEKLLETAASLAVHIHKQGYAIGMITNAVLTGSGKSMIQPGRNPRQIMMMLETMARMTMDCEREFRESMSRGFTLSWGMTCVLLACTTEDITLDSTYFLHRGIPCTGIAALESAEETSGGTISIRFPKDILTDGGTSDE